MKFLKISLTTQVLLAVAIGITLGITFGPLCSILKPIGTTFVMFIQMVIILYIPTSIIHGIGSTQPHVTKEIFKKGWFFLVSLWALVFLSIYLVYNIFPLRTTIVTPNPHKSELAHNFLRYLVPENPIYDLANNVAPAIAIFGIIMGIALMHLKFKEPLISFLERVNNTIETLLNGLTKVAPIGIAALFANAFGTVYLSDLVTLAYYLIPLISLTLILTFWALPALLMSCTSLRYREIIMEFKSTCLLAFVIGSPSIAIPYINKCIKKYGEKFHIEDENFHSTSQTIVPISYTFAQVGNFLILFFIFYLSSFFHHPIDWMEKGLVTLLTIPMSFGGPEMTVNSISFLVEKLGFPIAILDLYDNTSLISQNFQVLLSVASIVTFALLLLFGYYRLLKFRVHHLVRHFVFFFLVLSLGTVVIQRVFKEMTPSAYVPSTFTIQDAYPNNVDVTVFRNFDDLDQIMGLYKPSESDALVRALTSHVLRVGYYDRSPPFTYFNDDNELVGYNITMAYKLAQDLGVRLEFIPYTFENLRDLLNKNVIDIAMGPVLVTAYSEEVMNLPHSYMSTPNVLVVPKVHEHNYNNLDKLQARKDLILGGLGYFQQIASHYFPLSQTKLLTSETNLENAFESKKINALFWSKELALGYCIQHPNMVVVDYSGALGSGFLSYPVKENTFNLMFFINSWMDIQRSNGFEHSQYMYWMIGRTVLPPPPRWSILRQVMHWQNDLE